MKRLLKKLIKTAVMLVLIAGIAVGGIYTAKGYNMYRDAVAIMPMEELVETIQADPDYVEMDQLTQTYVDAVISAEDRRFRKHSGFDILAIGRALWNDILAGAPVEGGSTISQQLMKNEYFTQEKKVERKVAEIFAAMELERKYDKNTIFELYVNTIYFGSGYYGIHDAAYGYYGTDPSDLNDYQSVMLAGLPNAPSAYSPDVSPQLAQQRMDQVLERMVKCRKITEEEAETIRNGRYA